MNRTGSIDRLFEVRALDIPPAQENQPQEMWVEGYASVFDSPTVLFEIDGIEYKEQIARGAFDNAKMDDVILNFDHQGKVFARTRNKTLQLSIDERGLFIRARLDGTEEGRKMYDEIRGGYIDRMSFAFTIAEESFDRDNRMWTILRVKRLYDVCACSIPAYDDTSISARRDVAEADARERRQQAEADLLRQRAKAKLKL
jgi:HK97 family phage prohead protease